MSQTAQPIEWYIARDGRQHGPLKDGEMQKLVELGHLRPTDLVWRAGMTDWRLASVVFQRQPQPAHVPPRQAAPQPTVTTRPDAGGRQEPQRVDQVAVPTGHTETRPQSEGRPISTVTAATPSPGTVAARPQTTSVVASRPAEPMEDDDDIGRPRWGRRIAAILGVVVVASGAVYGLKATGYANQLPSFGSIVAPVSKMIAGLMPGGGSHAAETLTVPPFVALGETPEAIDGALQKAAAWKVAKREFPEWYAERVKEAAGLRAAKTDNAGVMRRLAESFVELRRKHADQALAAAPERVGVVATAFLDSLRSFSKHSVEACYGYISQGEISPPVLQLSAAVPHAEQLQRQVTAVLDAIADGRRSPRTYLPPRKGDYDVLAKELTSRGWSDADLKTFSDPKSLARSTPEQVCKMVQDWFAAQMAIKDVEIRQRLLVESLRPVVAG